MSEWCCCSPWWSLYWRWDLVGARIRSSFLSSDVCSSLRSFRGTIYLCVSLQSHEAMMQWHDILFVECECGYWYNFKPLPHLTPPQPSSLHFEVFEFFRLFRKQINSKVPSLLQSYFDQKSVQTILAIIQQKKIILFLPWQLYIVCNVGESICMKKEG